jgi:hypothetical protein
MAKPTYKSSIPPSAEEVVEQTHENGAKKTAHYYVGDERVGFREWSQTGTLLFEYGLKGGEKHGYEYEFYDSGALLEKGAYRKGKLHGPGVQLAENGRVLVVWKLDNGCGLDLWCDQRTGLLAEEVFWPAQGEQGYKRLWNEDQETIWEEWFFAPGMGYHGIRREWDGDKLCRGFPQFYIGDKKVSRARYLSACKTDKTLPKYRAADDKPTRRLPAEYLAQRRGQ